MIHLNPVGVSADGTSCASASACSSDPLTSDDAYVPRTPRRSSQSASSAPPRAPQAAPAGGEQRPDLVTGELAAVADDGTAVGVRVLGDRDVGPDLLGE